MGRPTDQLIDAVQDAEALVRLLIDAGRDLPPRLRERILAFGPAVIPPLVALMENEELSLDTAPGEGWGPIHAVELLGELRAPEATGPMLRLLAETEWDTIIHDRLLQALPRLGPEALEPTLAAYAAATDPYLRGNYCSVLANLGVRDDRIYAALLEDLDRDLVLGAGHFAEYGDPRALPVLTAALDQYESQGDEVFANQGLIELAAAIEDLGGELTPVQREKMDHILAPEMVKRKEWSDLIERAGRRPEAGLQPARKVGRNELCPCGSGKKYKKCCLGKR
jgi:SEC-C motif-containing protein